MAETNGNEEWRDVVGFEGIYSVSSHGRIRRNGAVNGVANRILKPWSRVSGHLTISFCVNSKITKIGVHRVVLIAFHGSPPGGMECLHRDGNPKNNHLTNLRWGTRSENIADALRHGTFNVGSRHVLAKLSEGEIAAIRALRERGWTQRRIASAFCVCQQLISQILIGKKWVHV